MSTNCQFHCGACGRCFATLAAFDLHRSGSFPKGSRRCREPERVRTRSGEARMIVVKRADRCSISKLRNVQVWGEA